MNDSIYIVKTYSRLIFPDGRISDWQSYSRYLKKYYRTKEIAQTAIDSSPCFKTNIKDTVINGTTIEYKNEIIEYVPKPIKL